MDNADTGGRHGVFLCALNYFFACCTCMFVDMLGFACTLKDRFHLHAYRPVSSAR